LEEIRGASDQSALFDTLLRLDSRHV
jgi:hypothetical protein